MIQCQTSPLTEFQYKNNNENKKISPITTARPKMPQLLNNLFQKNHKQTTKIWALVQHPPVFTFDSCNEPDQNKEPTTTSTISGGLNYGTWICTI